MDYCGPTGVPLATFREWDEVSYAAALAWQTRRNQRCDGCGLDAADTVGDRDGFTALPIFCGGCAAIARASRHVRADAEHDHTATDGVRFRVTKDG